MTKFIPTGDATAILPTGTTAPITVIGTEAIRETFDDLCIQQAINSRTAPGVTELVLNPDAHCGYGAPVGCVMASPTHIYPGPVGVDIKCSMSLLQLDLPADAVTDRKTRRALINAICERTPTGTGKGQRSVKKARHVDEDLGKRAVIEGASPDVCADLGIPAEWADRCEDSFHVGHDETTDALAQRLDQLLTLPHQKNFAAKAGQLGSYGGGNHFGECEVVEIAEDQRAQDVAKTFGLVDGHVAFLSHCGSRGFGHNLASYQFKLLQSKFERWGIPLPGADRQLVYAPLGTAEANDYLDDMALGSNFATVNHLLINALVLEAFQEVLPGTIGQLVYFISHNIARQEIVNNQKSWVHRKGATRAIPGGHFSLAGTPFAETGHPILLPGNPRDGSAVMVADAGAEKSCYSVNHGAGRVLGRKRAIRELDQSTIDREFDEQDILSNCRFYPKDEAPAAYKDFNEVLRSVKQAGLASEVARLKARFVIKDASKADD
ncbi:RtcB family protein [Rhodopirellula sp. MGV]|uniref:RtcB family protein n=1 Tax=Rhodopirellula sp. MGV TaxID=2023130 RepID=UPI000B971CEA|nr:RtcB family protein [Rhodopirellula sp. MGV]OYP37294.1 RNA-splicing ligase RtcB [Rhodopirellula sp. MGV]PNY38070.1 RtcB family protein [Rhodopirellula baltica]